MGSGGAFDARGTVTPGIDGIRGGKLMSSGLLLPDLPLLVGIDATKTARWPKRAAEARRESISARSDSKHCADSSEYAELWEKGVVDLDQHVGQTSGLSQIFIFLYSSAS